MATEFAAFALKEGETPHEPNSRTAAIFQEGFDTLAQQPGFQRLYWGTEVENPRNWRLAIDWDSVDAHVRFTKSDGYGAFVSRLGEVLDLSQGRLFHAHLSPHPAVKAISQPASPVTETLLIFFPASYSKADQEAFEAGLRNNFLAALETQAGQGAFTAAAGGWVVEELPIPDSAPEELGKAYLLLIGWTSVQAHLDFRNAQVFKDNVHWLRGAKDRKAVSLVHVSSTLVGSA